MGGTAVKELDSAKVLSAINRLRASRPDVFGADGHGFVLNPPLCETDVQAFEHQHRISLPDDYRQFITRIGNGGAGPYYGVFPLGQMDGLGESLKPWQEADGFVGVLSEPFLFRDAWNDLRRKPAKELMKTDEHEYERQLDEFESVYWGSAPMNGAIPICHEGCALRIWIVLCGPEAGHLWYDGRADYTGLSPLFSRDGSRAMFGGWYREWLEDALTGTAPAKRT
jgi:hypothetical protein